MMIPKKITTRRIDELDLLRGFFIVVIILDHAQFWPSPLQYLTGKGQLWVSAAEGFFIISGLLIGYLRIYKDWHTPLRVLSKKLVERALLLYLWGIGITFTAVALSMLLPGDGALLPKLPNADQLSTLPTYIWSVISTNYSSDWIYFLRLYAIMLLATPLFIWLIRKGWWFVAVGLSLGIYTISLVFGINEGSMQWQILFFGAALIGWKLEFILTWLHAHPRIRTVGMASVITFTLVTMVASYFFVHGWGIVESPRAVVTRDAYLSIRANVDPLFSNNPMVPLRISLAFIWFIGLLGIFHIGKKYIQRAFGWLLMPFGTQSLSLYCLQALLLPFIVALVPMGGYFYNGLIGALVVVVLWGIMKLPLVQKILPR